MTPIQVVAAIVAFAITPALLFLGLYRGLERMQQAPVVQNAANRVDADDPTVSIGDAINGIRTGGLVPDGSTTNASTDGCQCGADNPSYASYCGDCSRRL